MPLSTSDVLFEFPAGNLFYNADTELIRTTHDDSV